MRKERISPNELDLKEHVVAVNRTAKVVKGGRRFGFNAIVVVGDGKGHVGFGLGKGKEVTDAISKGAENAKKTLIRVPVVNGTLPHEIKGKYGAGKVFLKPASPGTGVIAGGAVRAIMEAAGVHDVLSKSMGSNNPHNVVKATIDALVNLVDISTLAQRRGMTVREVFFRNRAEN